MKLYKVKNEGNLGAENYKINLKILPKYTMKNLYKYIEIPLEFHTKYTF